MPVVTFGDNEVPVYAAKMKLAEAGQLGLIPTRLLSQLGPVSTWSGQLGLVLFKVI